MLHIIIVTMAQTNSTAMQNTLDVNCEIVHFQFENVIANFFQLKIAKIETYGIKIQFRTQLMPRTRFVCASIALCL